jgi:hypothetical protein
MAVMGKVEIKIPLVTWRDGRPRFWPGAALRRLGYAGEDLRHGKSGSWFSLDEAIAWSAAKVAEIDDRRRAIAAGQTTPRKAANDVRRAAAARGGVSVAELFTAFRDTNPRMNGVSQVEGRKVRKALSAGTVRFYRGAISQLENFDGGLAWHEPAADLTARVLAGLIDRYETQHGLAQTRALRATISAVYAWGATRAGKYRVARNPVADLEETLPVLPPRVRVGTIEEMLQLLAVADCLGFPEIGDAIALGLFTGQRQNDRLALSDMQLTAEGIRFQQSKKGGQPLLIPAIAPLQTRLEAMRARRHDWRVNIGGNSLPPYPNVLLDERQRRPWDANTYGKAFRAIRHAAATGQVEDTPFARRMLRNVSVGEADPVPARLAAAGLSPMPSLADFHDQDCRDTAVTWLALCGCDKWQVASITGHTLSSIDTILKHYFGAHPDLARGGMARLEAYWKRMVG